MELLADREDVPARVFESAGGYAPTIGILGAVIGLIHVMGNLTDPAKLGAGVAVAFVATIYGVGSANLILLPLASKLRQRAEAATRRREMLIDAALAVQEGINPRPDRAALLGSHRSHPASRGPAVDVAPGTDVMRRRRRLNRRVAPPSHERWLVSYADFITLMFAFFTVLYASSTVDARKMKTVVDSMQRVFDSQGAPPPAAPPAEKHIAPPLVDSTRRRPAGRASRAPERPRRPKSSRARRPRARTRGGWSCRFASRAASHRQLGPAACRGAGHLDHRGPAARDPERRPGRRDIPTTCRSRRRSTGRTGICRPRARRASSTI